MKYYLWVATLALLPACSDWVAPGPPPTFTITPTSQWSGGTVLVRSESFVGQNGLPILFAGTDTVRLTRVGDSTATAVVPLGFSGPVNLEAVVNRLRAPVGTVQRVGFREVRALGIPLGGELYLTQISSEPVVFGALPTANGDGDIASVELSTGYATIYRGLRAPGWQNYGMSPTEAPGVFIVENRKHGQLERWQLYPRVGVLDTVPATIGGLRHVVRMAPHLWLKTTSHDCIIINDTLGIVRWVGMESVWSAQVSPRGDRTAISVSYISPLFMGDYPGVPVFANTSGDSAFTLPLSGTEAVTFSADGARLFLTGPYLSHQIFAVDAGAGVRIAEQTVPDSAWPVALAHDPLHDLLLVTAATYSGTALLVYDASSLTLLGVLPAPEIVCSARFTICQQGVLAVDPVRRKAYMIASARNYAFDMIR